MTNINPAERAVLTILDGCPSGATEHNLCCNHNVKPATLYKLVVRDFIRPELRTIRPPWNWKIQWVKITDKGRVALQQPQEDSDHGN
jgi:hypothetical protein